MIDCPSDDAIVDLIEGRLDGPGLDAITLHLDACAACRELVADAARGAQPAHAVHAARAPLARSAVVGRYVVLDPIGAGSMGAVYAAYDPDLDRKVALKLLRADALAARSSASLGPRLLREAQALAQLSHPNVVTVYDVADLGGEIFIAMEFVDGGTLAGWLHAAPRSVEAILDRFRQAGEGLAAAHEAGIVHRDFKPENVLIGRDGRARVSDFGLARSSGTGAPAATAIDATATQTGALVGTPAYMAPEQWDGRPSDARADLFGFCVALYEALYGERPFAGDDVASLRAAMQRDQVRPAPPRSRVPAAIRRALLRGLRADPDQRWPGMRPLLAALAPPSQRHRWGIAIAAMVALVAAVASRSAAAPAPLCTGAEAEWGEVFDDARQDAVKRAFEATRLPSAPFAFASVRDALGRYRQDWTAMHREACEATRVRGSQSEALLDRRMACLESRRREAEALVSVLAAADEKLVLNAQETLRSLPPIAGCADTEALLAPDAPPREPERRAELGRLDAELARASALRQAGRWKEGIEVITRALPDAERLGHRPLTARMYLVRGLCEIRGPQKAAIAEPSLHEAARLALLARDDATAADAWSELIEAAGFYGGRPDEAERWGRYAEAAIARLGGDDEREAMRLQRLAGNAWYRRARPEEAQDYLRRERALLEKRHGPDDLGLASPLEILAGTLVDTDRMEEALALYQKTYALRERALGPDHPSLASSLLNEAVTLTVLGRPDEALAIFRRIEARWPAVGGAAYAKHRTAEALRRKGDFTAALAMDRASLAVMVAEKAPAIDTMWPLTGEGLDQLGLGRPREAVAPLEQAVAAANGSDLPEETRFALARARWDAGLDRKRAREAATAARAEVSPYAERYGGRFQRSLEAIDRWLAEHRQGG